MGKRNEKCLKRPQSNTINKVTKETPSNPIFISEKCLIMMIIVLLAIVIAVAVNANELQTTNDETVLQLRQESKTRKCLILFLI